MFILPGILGLVTLIFARPFEFVEILQGIPFLYVFFGLSLFGYAVDLRLGFTEVRATPHLPWAITFVLWCVFTGLVKAPAMLGMGVVNIAVFFILFFLIAHGIRTFRAFEAVAGIILACTIWVAGVCAHQGLAPFECVAVAPGEDHTSAGTPDGRPCDDIPICYDNPPDPEALYRCEQVGLFGTTSIGHGRVRYVGVLHDPNEVAMVVSVAMPLAFAFYQRRRSKKRLLILIATVVLVAMTVIFSQSRGGQLVFIAVIGVYFLERYGFKGLVAGAIMSAPMLLLGGRSSQEADSSSAERLECWYAGTLMFKSSPAIGVGFGQFTQYHFLTAHNSFVLAAAELGIIGLVIWMATAYVALKIPFRALFDLRGVPGAEPARIWALALLSSLVGMMVGVFFLSFNYHYILWIYLGLPGAFYLAVRSHMPEWTVRFGWRDLALVSTAAVGLLGLIFVYVRLKLP